MFSCSWFRCFATGSAAGSAVDFATEFVCPLAGGFASYCWCRSLLLISAIRGIRGISTRLAHIIAVAVAAVAVPIAAYIAAHFRGVDARLLAA